MSEPLYWQLVYASGDVVDEEEDGASILFSPPHPLALVVTRQAPGGREPLTHIPLTASKPPGHGPWRPVFYRKRSLGLDGGAEGILDLVVFGRACEGPDNVDGTLWAIDRLGKVIDCPEWAKDSTAVENLVMSAGKV